MYLYYLCNMPSNVVVHTRQHGKCLACCCCCVVDKCVVFIFAFLLLVLLLLVVVVVVYSVVHLVVVLYCCCWCCTTSSGRVGCKCWFQMWWCICTVSAKCRQTWRFTHGSMGNVLRIVLWYDWQIFSFFFAILIPFVLAVLRLLRRAQSRRRLQRWGTAH